MKSWLKNILSNLRANRYTVQRIKEAYVLGNSRYLRKAFRYARPYVKRSAAWHLGRIASQKNVDFLLARMPEETDIHTKKAIYAAILNAMVIGNIDLTHREEEYLNQHFYLLDSEENELEDNTAMQSPTSAPITFRDRLRDHLGDLEDMKRNFETLM